MNYDIVARFNSSLDDPNATNCNGLRLYYGLDNQHGNNIDLLTVVLHEFGHGLGFISLTDNGTGDFPAGRAGHLGYVLYDEGSGKHWMDLDARRRQASAISGALAWDGPAVKAAVPTTLGIAPLVRDLRAPGPFGGEGLHQDVTIAQFSAPDPGRRRLGSTRRGLHRVRLHGQGQARAAGRADRDSRPRRPVSRTRAARFVEKARNAQDAGAIGLLVANNTTGRSSPRPERLPTSPSRSL